VILNDSSPGSDPVALKHIAAYVAECKSQPDWETAAQYGRALIGKDWDLDDAGWMRLARNSYSEGTDGLLHLDYDPGIAWPLQRLLAGRGRPRDLWRIFGGLKNIPALALRGAVSNVLSVETLERMIAEKPDLAHVTVAGIGHAPQLDEPEAQAAIDEFLAKL
jgi:pimeloyl-ACP methyl ester carboxylesterase